MQMVYLYMIQIFLRERDIYRYMDSNISIYGFDFMKRIYIEAQLIQMYRKYIDKSIEQMVSYWLWPFLSQLWWRVTIHHAVQVGGPDQLAVAWPLEGRELAAMQPMDDEWTNDGKESQVIRTYCFASWNSSNYGHGHLVD